jgi:metal-dependent amidase/aminoacylase/carboxypeptidase family protein
LLGVAVLGLPAGAKAQPRPTDAYLDQTRARWEGLAKQVWDAAELALHEKRSAKALADVLQKEGFKVTWGLGGEETAFVAVAGSGTPTVALLAEYDALPGLSQVAGQPTKTAVVENGSGHGCGHNLLGTATVAAALAANRERQERKLPGTIQLFGTPAEEVLREDLHGARRCLQPLTSCWPGTRTIGIGRQPRLASPRPTWSSSGSPPMPPRLVGRAERVDA